MKTRLENGTVLEVGKRYTDKDWITRKTFIEITAIGRDSFLGIESGENWEQQWNMEEDWIPYEEPLSKEELKQLEKSELVDLIYDYWSQKNKK